jgi:hypothetical protein
MRSATTRGTRAGIAITATVLTLAGGALLSACGGDDGDATTDETGLPAMVVSDGSTTTRLEPAGGCSRIDGAVVCGDPAPPDCADPEVTRVSAGILTLGFDEPPRRVEVLIGDDATAIRLPVTPGAAWRPPATGPAVFLADLPSGRLLYTACLVPAGDAGG